MNSDLKEKSPSAFSQKTYTDEPILRTAAQMKNYEPPQYREMRRINYFAYEKGWSAEHIFFEQAKFMADFEDDYEYSGSFSSYFPTYTAMNPEQQRGYFSWRTRVRRGEICPAATSFVFIYIYELLNLIGVNNAEEAFFKLHSLYKACLPFAPELEKYVPVWMNDMIAFYDLDASLFSSYCDLAFEKKLAVLQNAGTAEQKKLFSCVNELSSYKISDSYFYKLYPEETERAVCEAFRQMSEKYGKTHKTSFTESLFGRLCVMPYTVFGAAVFFDRSRVADHQTVLDENYVYRFINGQGTCLRCWGKREKSPVLAGYIKYTESVLREVFCYEKSLHAESPSKPFVKIAQKAAENAYRYHINKKRRDELAFVDSSLLDSIMASAEKTRDKLLTDEETDEQNAQPPHAEPEVPTEAVPACSLPLSADELGFVSRLLGGADAETFLKQKGLKISLVCDSINEKLFDLFSDNIIDFDGDTPILIEDYTEDISGMIPEFRE